MSTQVIPAAVTSPSEGEKPTSEEPPQPRPSSKAILRKALALANDAVLSDTANNVDGAVEAYSEAVRLLDIVLGSMENESDKAKLRDIHATYSERIRLLSKLSNHSVPAAPPRATTPPPPTQLPPPIPKSEPEPVPNSSTDPYAVRNANVQAPNIVMMPSTSTPTPGKAPTRRKMNRRSASFSEMNNQRVSVFNIPPPPPFQPPQQLKETSSKNRSQMSLEIPKVTSLSLKKKSPSLPVPPPPADPPFSAVKPVDLTQNTESLSVVTDELEDPVRTLANVLSESPTDMHRSNTPPPPFHSIVNNKSAQQLKPPPRTHSIIGHTVPRARKSSLFASNVYRSASPGQEDHETNANQAFARLTGQRAPAEVLRVGSAEGSSGERFDRNATIKALSLMRSLELSMTVGCHITQRLYVPKNLWYQPNIRLSSVDVKVSICETLLMSLTRLEAWQRLDDIRGSLAQLVAMENTLENAKVALTRKLGMPRSKSEHSLPNDEPEIYRKETQARKHQSIIAWGSKFTKSVERMNAFNLAKSTDDPHQYVDTLVRLFRSVHVLDAWLRHYHALLLDPSQPHDKKPQLDAVVQKIGSICLAMHTTVCSFVIRDLSVMLGKWVKRGGGWVGE
ncbi:hypothetical protein BC943DRAFT_359598 [Umbelopsis sp. AD052]|nr:hypothetical protein BC943DRAFT_359598 [Umbelopsis sp. AD052]